MGHACDKVTLKSEVGHLLHSLDTNHLQALKVMCLALSVEKVTGDNYNAAATLKAAVLAFFNEAKFTLNELQAVVAIDEAIAHGASTANFENTQAGLAAIDKFHAALSPQELRGAEVFLRCKLAQAL